jgi:formylglycine-generating enzyme required for sulfatase activity
MRHVLALAAVLVLAGLCLAAEFKSDEAVKAQADYAAAIEAAKLAYGQGLVKAKETLDAKVAAATDAISREAIQAESAAVTEELVRLRAPGVAAFEPREWKSAETKKVRAAYAADLKAAQTKYIPELAKARQAVLARKTAAADLAAKDALQAEIALIEQEQATLRGDGKGAKVSPSGAQGKELSLDLGGGVTMKLVLIPAGKFMMGSPDSEQGRNKSEGPQHEVVISKPFYMGVTEVTQAQYEAVMGTNPSNFKDATNPVEMVSLTDATEFCKKLSEKTGQAVRLPTEAEWEYACRAGSNTRFSFGDSDSILGDYAWWQSNSGGKTHPVGQKKPNAWGLYDMHGNVWEWCANWLGSYSSGSATDPRGPGSGGYRVLRGGSWSSRDADSFRCAFRDRLDRLGLTSRRDYNGFRCARTLF